MALKRGLAIAEERGDALNQLQLHAAPPAGEENTLAWQPCTGSRCVNATSGRRMASRLLPP